MPEENREKEVSDLTQIKIFVGFIAAVIIVIILQELKSIFIPLFMALLLYFFFNGVVKRLLRLKVPIALVLLFLLVFIFIVFYFFGVLIYAGASSFVDKFPAYSDKITAAVKSLFDQLKLSIPDLDKYIDTVDWSKSIDTSAITSIISSTFGSFAAFIGNLAMVLIFLMFMLAGRNALTARITKAFDENQADKIKYVINSIEDQVQHYLLIKTFVSFLTGLIGGIILFAGQFDFVIFSALLIFVLNFIPNFGSIIATLFPILIGFLKFGFSLRVLVVALGLILTQFSIGNIIEPKITGRSLNLSPIVILISLIFWWYVWGIVGMMLAVPLTSALKIFFQNIPALRPIAEIISAERG
ncbi:MAG: AI-2E family transporter [Candidatus Aminicenantes bacterium]|nr:AI-2E family transporter [Candidatus Aminicenantes bacterium]NIM79802.1 AI-2E family transporter [Candidatus Aminicenantes bacterium]NIN19132.1 AI-2E family transporter [Candidatus Aminicenantes bacterium]NIN43036.1 AI-2E family transporter [Candidatus Aminicenantes bacterium]NIN85777.1 AI-2E family transporter [Candidatus Aminicenantes bacterium]